MSAALHYPFATCRGIEIVPYRHNLALTRFQAMQKAGGILPNQSVTSSLLQLTDPVPLPWTSELLMSHLLDLPRRISFAMGDMFSCDLSTASVIFIYSTCFGPIIQQIAHKLANDAREGCLVITTTYQVNHPGLELVKTFAPNTLLWTFLYVYKRVGSGPCPERHDPASDSRNVVTWEAEARKLLTELLAV